MSSGMGCEGGGGGAWVGKGGEEVTHCIFHGMVQCCYQKFIPPPQKKNH